MKIERTKNAARNTLFGVLYKFVVMLFPFVIRTAMIYFMGLDYVGLSSLFTSILSFLSLAELGVGSALMFSMYKPIAEDDKDTICALLNLYRKLYFVIGTVIFVIGIVLLPFLPYLIKGEYPADINLYVLYCIYLLNTVISYWLFGYKQSLLTAHQRSDIISKRSLVIQAVMYICQMIVICLARNYYLYIILLPIFTIITNLANALIVNKMYPEYRCRGSVSKELSKSIQKKCLALFGTKANSVVLHSLDNIVISAFLGLTVVSIYGNYYYIMNAIIGVMAIIYDSLTAGIGNSIVIDTPEKVYKDFNTLSFLNAWLVCFCSASLLCLFQPFMAIWVGEELMFSFDIVLLLVVYFYFYESQKIVITYKDAAGIWWEDRLRPYVVMAVNLIGNLIMVQLIGIYGVILSTILSYIVSIPWCRAADCGRR
ncbi:MAG: polysaccharide biosynthesis protein [Lachnospiraceae bacterium]|nr:polysaccharide biosynthesis protein [Lachnospiraceae bacterium]